MNIPKPLQLLSYAIVSVGGIGFLKPASATWGSAAVAVILFYIFPALTPSVKVLVAIATFLIGWVACEAILSKTKQHDPHFVVIDEAVGMMITCFFLPQNAWYFFIAFVLFRFFDIGKFWPASIVDRKNTSLSVMFDDVIMAVPALICMELVRFLISSSPHLLISSSPHLLIS